MKTIIARLMMAAVIFTATTLVVGCGETTPPAKSPSTPQTKPGGEGKDGKKEEMKKEEKK